MKKLNYKLFILLALGVAACAKSDPNPAKDYADLPVVKPHGEVAPTQQEMTNPFVIDVVGPYDQNVAQFSEGETKTIQLSVRVLEPDIKRFVLRAFDLPKGMVFGQNPQVKNQYTLTWTPKLIVPAGQPDTKFTIRLEAAVVETRDPRLRSIVKNHNLQIVVAANRKVPVIEGLSWGAQVKSDGQRAHFEEGSVIPFAVVISDPSSFSNIPPKMSRVPYEDGGNSETFKADALGFVRPDRNAGAPRKVDNNGKWEFRYILDLKSMTLPTPLKRDGSFDLDADSVNMCFSFQGESQAGVPSADYPFCFSVSFKSKAPEIVWPDTQGKGYITLRANALNRITFFVRAVNGRGSLDIQGTDFEALPGPATLVCAKAKDNQVIRTCEIEWFVSCDMPSPQVVEVKATNKVGNRENFNTSRREFRVEKSGDACPPPTPRPAKKVKKTIVPVPEETPVPAPSVPAAEPSPSPATEQKPSGGKS
ncbi:MAG: hypothetical protein IT289_12190 [Oligoflexia bacterium]|nr:hypothetical protein [Oligoflexia bacterium]